MQLVVVSAVRNAVRAATNIFTVISINFVFFIFTFLHCLIFTFSQVWALSQVLYCKWSARRTFGAARANKCTWLAESWQKSTELVQSRARSSYAEPQPSLAIASPNAMAKVILLLGPLSPSVLIRPYLSTSVLICPSSTYKKAPRLISQGANIVWCSGWVQISWIVQTERNTKQITIIAFAILIC